jgi:hypothetical protein
LERFGNPESLGRLWHPRTTEEVLDGLSKGIYDGRLVEFWTAAKKELGISDVEPLMLEE